MDQAVKDAIIESVSVHPDDIEDQLSEIVRFGSDVIDNSPPAFTMDQREENAKAGMALLLEKAEELGLTGGQFIAAIIQMAVTTGKADGK